MHKAPDSRNFGGEAPLFVELPHGFFTASGTWFHITRQALDEYAADVVEAEGFEKIVADAERWLRSSATLSLWIFILSVLVVPAWQALLGSAVWFAGWSLLGPGFVNRPMIRLLRYLEPVWLQGLAYVAVLSWLAAGDQIGTMVVGLLWFVLVRWGLFAGAIQPILGRIQARLYGLAIPDQILRAVIVRAALAHRLGLPQLDAMERRMLEIAHRHRSGKTSD